MKYCLFDAIHSPNEVISRIEKENLIPFPIYYIEYYSQNQAKQDYKKIQDVLENSNAGVFITIHSIDQQLQAFLQNLRKSFSLILAQGGLNKVNRLLLESTSIDVLVDPHSSKYKIKRDFIHHFNSGINHVLASFAKEKQTVFMISLEQFRQKKKNLAKDIGRIKQNIEISRKYSIPLNISYIVSKPIHVKTLKEKDAILTLLGASKEQITQARTAIDEKIEYNNKKNSPQFIYEGLHIGEY